MGHARLSSRLQKLCTTRSDKSYRRPDSARRVQTAERSVPPCRGSQVTPQPTEHQRYRRCRAPRTQGSARVVERSGTAHMTVAATPTPTDRQEGSTGAVNRQLVAWVGYALVVVVAVVQVLAGTAPWDLGVISGAMLIDGLLGCLLRALASPARVGPLPERRTCRLSALRQARHPVACAVGAPSLVLLPSLHRWRSSPSSQPFRFGLTCTGNGCTQSSHPRPPRSRRMFTGGTAADLCTCCDEGRILAYEAASSGFPDVEPEAADQRQRLCQCQKSPPAWSTARHPVRGLLELTRRR